MEGLNENTLRIVNEKIKDIKNESESKLLFHIQKIQELQEENATFKKLKDSLGLTLAGLK